MMNQFCLCFSESDFAPLFLHWSHLHSKKRGSDEYPVQAGGGGCGGRGGRWDSVGYRGTDFFTGRLRERTAR